MAKIDKIITNSAKETMQIGINLSKKLKKGSIIAFFGDLGAGKTTLIKGIVNAFSDSEKIKINVNSPTFVYLNIYEAKKTIYHFDMYRIKNKEEFYELGFEEYLSSNGICLIEWAENIIDILPKNSLIIKMDNLSEFKREIIINYL